jgi:hypothetical protein
MSEHRDAAPRILGTKRGFPIYSANPSVTGEVPTRGARRRLGQERKGLLLDAGAGEIFGQGSAIIYEWEEVDAERFVKLYLDGMKQAADLTKAGLTLFRVVYQEIREHPNNDTVQLSHYGLRERIPEITERNYHRGLQELLQKQFLFRSPYDGTFFINIRYMFNGDRLGFVKAYRLKRPKRREPTIEGQLALDGVA